MNVQQITKSRERFGITQKRFSKMLKKTDTYACKLENGKRKLTPELSKQIKAIFANARQKMLAKAPAKKATKKVAKRATKKVSKKAAK
jgi:predicted transcriptional regulator